MYHELIRIGGDLFHGYGYVCSATGKTLEELDKNIEKKFMKTFTESWTSFGGSYSKKKGWYDRDSRWGEYDKMKTMNDVVEYFGIDRYITKNGEFIKGYSPNECH